MLLCSFLVGGAVSLPYLYRVVLRAFPPWAGVVCPSLSLLPLVVLLSPLRLIDPNRVIWIGSNSLSGTRPFDAVFIFFSFLHLSFDVFFNCLLSYFLAFLMKGWKRATPSLKQFSLSGVLLYFSLLHLVTFYSFTLPPFHFFFALPSHI